MLFRSEGTRPVRGRVYKLNPKYAEAVKVELAKLEEAKIIVPIEHSEWLSPMVIAPKKNSNKIRVCVDFRALNKSTIKDGFPMPFTERVLEDVAGHALYSFMDGFSGYNQVAIHPADQAKTAFITPWGTFIYTKMAFGLRNAPPTFNRIVQITFGPLLLSFLRVFMDDFSNFTGIHSSTPTEAFQEHLLQLAAIFDKC